MEVVFFCTRQDKQDTEEFLREYAEENESGFNQVSSDVNESPIIDNEDDTNLSQGCGSTNFDNMYSTFYSPELTSCETVEGVVREIQICLNTFGGDGDVTNGGDPAYFCQLDAAERHPSIYETFGHGVNNPQTLNWDSETSAIIQSYFDADDSIIGWFYPIQVYFLSQSYNVNLDVEVETSVGSCRVDYSEYDYDSEKLCISNVLFTGANGTCGVGFYNAISKSWLKSNTPPNVCLWYSRDYIRNGQCLENYSLTQVSTGIDTCRFDQLSSSQIAIYKIDKNTNAEITLSRQNIINSNTNH